MTIHTLLARLGVLGLVIAVLCASIGYLMSDRRVLIAGLVSAIVANLLLMGAREILTRRFKERSDQKLLYKVR